MEADDVVRAPAGGGYAVEVEIGGVAREHGARPRGAAEPPEDVGLDRHVLEGGLDDEVDAGERLPVRGRAYARQPPIRLFLGEATARDLAAVEILDPRGAGA